MKINFMFASPKNIDSLYEYSEETCETPFGDIESVRKETCLSKEYSESVISDIKSAIIGLTECNYCGCRERISREVYQFVIDECKYEVAFVFDKWEDNNVQLSIEIISPEINNEDFEAKYDMSLEKIKLALKDRLKRDWSFCTWLTDDQSEMLCTDLYHRFFKDENQIRAFVNKVMIQHLGNNWLDQPGFEKYKESVANMEVSFKQIVPTFANINTSLLSVTMETLSDIMLKAVTYKESTTLTSADVLKLYQFLNNRNEGGAKELVQNKREIKIWDDVFSRYFDDPERFRKQLTQFIKSRNHIAHNKLLSFVAFKQIHDELTAFEKTIRDAITSFEEKNASEELRATWMYEQEQEEYDSKYEKEYIRNRIIGETGIEIRDENAIYEMFYETVSNLCEGILDKYHFDPCFDVINCDALSKNSYTEICRVVSNASEEKLEIRAFVSIDDDMDSTSDLVIEARHGESVISKAECVYHNGDGHEGEEGLYIADSDSEYDDSQMEDFFEELVAYIEDDLNPFVKELSSLEYEAGRYGGSEPVADFACQECGRNGVSVIEDLMPIGKCCYCGYENEVHICKLCGTVYDDVGGDEHICNGCMPRDEE